MKNSCYCGRETNNSHLCHAEDSNLCHAEGYTCPKEATQRFYHQGFASLSGQQMKLSVVSTWSCDEHWERFKTLRNVQEVIQP